MIDVVSRELCTDTRRTYATGHSGGGRMTSALGCRIADRIAAIAPNAGLRAGRPDPDDVPVPEVEDCRPARPLPVLTFHGQEDVVNPYPGNGDLRWGYAVPLAVQTWARLDDCRHGPQATTVSEHVTRFSYTRVPGRGGGPLLPRIERRPHLAGLERPAARARARDPGDRRVTNHVGLLRELPPLGARVHGVSVVRMDPGQLGVRAPLNRASRGAISGPSGRCIRSAVRRDSHCTAVVRLRRRAA